jgi:serine/threonine protein kinase
MITQLVSESTHEEFVDKHKSEMTLHTAFILQQCHEFHIFHRNLQPKNILVQQGNSHVPINEIKLVFIDFGSVWIDSEQLSITDEDDLKIFDQVILRTSTKGMDKTFCTLMQLWALKNQRCSPTVDTTSVLYIDNGSGLDARYLYMSLMILL